MCEPITFVWISIFGMAVFAHMAKLYVKRDLLKSGLKSRKKMVNVSVYSHLNRKFSVKRNENLYRFYIILNIFSGLSIFYAGKISLFLC